MPTIIVKGTPIEIPASGASPNWSPAIIEAFQALSDAVNSFTGTFDVAPQSLSIDSFNPGIDVTIDNLVFPPLDVRASTIFYSVHRLTADSGSGDQKDVSEGGTIEVVYNDSRGAGLKWEIVRSYVGNASITFKITDTGQVTFTTTTLTGINHTGLISYRAIAVLN
jgi:hypothetical protein